MNEMNIDIGSLTMAQLCWAFLVVFFVFEFVTNVFDKIKLRLTKWYNSKKGIEDKTDLIKKHDNDIKNIGVKVDEITRLLKSFISETKKDTSISQRQTIINIYHEVKDKGYITEHDAQNFDEVLEQYERNGGNGFVHTTVVPFIDKMKGEHMYTSDAEAKINIKKRD